MTKKTPKAPCRAPKGTNMIFDNTTHDNNCNPETPEDLIAISFSEGPASNTSIERSEPMEWDEFSQMLSQPEQGLKDGSYFLRGKCEGTRCDSNMDPLSDIIIIDADNSTDGNSCPPPDYVTDTLNDLNYQFILYTSFSHTPENPKYRIILRLDRKVDQKESKQLYQGVIDTLSQNGIIIEKNFESSTWSQPWYFPRYHNKVQQNTFFHGEGGFKRLPVDEILAIVPEIKNTPTAELTSEQILKLKKSIPNCIKLLCSDTKFETTEHRNFNLIKMVLVAYSLSVGHDEAEAISLCQNFIDNYPFSNSLTTPEARLVNFKKCYQSMKQSGSKFSCATARALVIHENVIDCKKCAVEQPHDVEDVIKWVNETTENKEIIDGWIEKTKGMNAVSTDRVIQAVSQKVVVGKIPLKKDLNKQQKAWQRERYQQAREKRSAAREAEGKIEIYYSKTATGKAVHEMSQALVDSDVYRFASKLVTIENARPSSVRMVQKINENNGIYPLMPIINELTLETLRHEVEKVACCMEYAENGIQKEILWADLLLKGLMNIPKSCEKPLIGIVEHPYVDKNFNLVMDQGYDPITGLFKVFDFDNNFIEGSKISLKQSKAAYKYLCDEVMADFPFATSLDKAAAISVLLSALQRKLITDDSGCPGYLFNAPTPSTGKTTLAQVISYIIYNRPAAATSWSNNDEELAKHILGIFKEGHSCVLFDNLKSKTVLQSVELSKAITSATYSKRLLNKNKTETLPSSVLWLFTGNNISVAGDFNTRILSIRLDTKMADPDKRIFKRPNIGDWCLKNRSTIIHACLTILLAAKNIESKLPPSRYNEWDKFVRRPLFLAAKIDIAKLFDRNKDADPKIESQVQFLEIWHSLLGNDQVTSTNILDAAKVGPGCNDSAIGDAIKDISGGDIPGSAVFGKLLQGLKDRIVGGYKITGEISTANENKNRWLWSVEQVSDEDPS